MKIYEKMMEIKGWTKEECLKDCPRSINEMDGMYSLKNCNESGDFCEECHHQEIIPVWTYEKKGKDIWTSGKFYYTKEEAIELGIEFAKEEDLKEIRIGRRANVDVYSIDVDDILERISEKAYDDAGEVAEDYLDDVQAKHEIELEEKLNEVLLDWTTKHGYEPKFYKIEDIEIVTVEQV